MSISKSSFWRSSAVLAIFAATTPGTAARASEPVKIDLERRVSPSSVAAELTFFTANDRPYLNLTEIERLGGFHRGSIEQDVWSDSYWPDIVGGIAAPYNDSSALGNFIPFGTFRVPENKSLFMRTHGSLWRATDLLTDEQIEKMSPAEKYDLLVGDPNFTLSRTVWDKIEFLHNNKPKFTKSGQFEFDASGNFVYEAKKLGITPFWQGICNGWAAASLYLERPLHSFTLTNAKGQRIKFYPTDVQALASQLWARSYINNATDGSGPNAKPLIRHSGYRCNDKYISRDFPSGRAKNPACNDVNPGVWHLAVINRVGMNREGFIVDTRTADSVWNHPIKNYSFKYYKVTSGDFGSLEASKLPLSEVSEFKEHRSPKARFIVGVEMEAEFLNNFDAEKRETFSSAQDRKGTETYYYDLELDEANNVVGGEWRLNGRPDPLRQISDPTANSTTLDHPDFIWAPVPGSKAFALGDRLMGVDYGSWDGNGPVPPGIRTGAVNSSKLSQPLAEIVDLLIAHSRK